jgi:hypothetical protein
VLAAFCLTVAAPTWAAQVPLDDVTRCATVDQSRQQSDAVRDAISYYKNVIHGGPRVGTINVFFHIITCKGEGNVPQSQIDAQMRELNNAYRLTGFSFRLAGVDRTENCQYFNNATSPGTEKAMKQQLAIDPAHTFNVYSVKPGHYLLGWAYFPQSFPEDNFMHGVVIHYGTFPGGYAAPYNLGGTLDHEAGHYLGLYHTFQGGCVDPGDYIDDTPFEASPAFGCPAGRNTCTQPGDDPIHNYMDYTDDACYSEFTNNQTDRMQYITAIYRPSLIPGSNLVIGGDAPAQSAIARTDGVGAGVSFRGAFPNPFAKETALHFTLAREGQVSLRLYNVAGQLVATLADRHMSAGEQTVALRASTLAPGMYFATLRHDGESVSRSVVLLP